MNKTTMVALLGRPLTSIEDTNYNLYLKIAVERLQDLTCLNLETATEDRTFDIREGYSTVFTDLFTEINSVTVGGETVTAYSARQWDRRNTSWYNSIVLDKCQTSNGEVTINADWGICSPELQLLLARLFGLLGQENKGNSNIKSKRVEDFHITYNDNSTYQQFLIDNQLLLDKYSICNIGNIQHGEVC